MAHLKRDGGVDTCMASISSSFSSAAVSIWLASSPSRSSPWFGDSHADSSASRRASMADGGGRKGPTGRGTSRRVSTADGCRCSHSVTRTRSKSKHRRCWRQDWWRALVDQGPCLTGLCGGLTASDSRRARRWPDPARANLVELIAPCATPQPPHQRLRCSSGVP